MRSASTLVVLIVAALACAAGMAQADIITHGSTTIDMDFVAVGNAWNTADYTGYGAVSYAYNIGTYEVSADQWAAVIAADPAVGNAGDWSGSQPTANVNWYEAAKFCNWLTTGSATDGYYTITNGVASIPDGVSHDAYAASNGTTTYFIPTEDEWYKAAYYDPAKDGGAGYWGYATGSDAQPTSTAGGTDAGTAVYVGQSAPADVDNAGGLSAYGTMAQGGNVWEWDEGTCVRGGQFNGDGGYDLQASVRRWGYGPTHEDSYIGFRVSAVEPPKPIISVTDGGWDSGSTWDLDPNTPINPPSDWDVFVRHTVTYAEVGQTVSSLNLDAAASNLTLGTGSSLASGIVAVSAGVLNVQGTLATNELYITGGMLTVNNVGAANLTANLSGTGSLAGSAAVNQVNVTDGTPAFSGNATAMTVTGGGITTTGGTIGTFNSNTGAGTSTIDIGTAITGTATVAAGTVNFNSTQANGTLAVTGGAVNIGSGAQVATANFQSGAGTVNAANPLAITSTLKLPGSITATLADAASFTAAGANLVDDNVARTLSLSGGTLALSVPGIGAPINLSSTGLNIADATHIKAQAYYTNDNRAPYCVSNWSGMTGSVGASGTADNGSGGKTWLDHPNSAGTSWISWDLGAEYTIGSIHIWNYNESALSNRGTKQLNLQTGDATAFANNTGWVNQLGNVDWTSIGANGTITGTVQGTEADGYAGFDWTLPAPITTRYLRFETLAPKQAYAGWHESLQGGRHLCA